MVKRAPPRRRPRKAKPGTKGLRPEECHIEELTGAARAAIAQAGGCVLGSYKEPLGGQPILFCVLPIDAVQPTPFQRDISDAHHKRLADVINKTGRFLDPVIAVARSEQRLLDTERPSSTGSHAPPRSQIDHSFGCA